MSVSPLICRDLTSRSIEYAQSLIKRPSITPNDAGCQDWLIDKLSSLGFECERFIEHGVTNLITKIGEGEQVIAFAGHTDVVTPGDEKRWQHPPFAAHIHNNYLYGRGAADMKTGVAAMLAAVERHIESGKPINQQFYWLITSDEEGEADFGSKSIKARLDAMNVALDMCLVGEPTAHKRTGDNIKVGRRGSVSAKLLVKGVQGHVAYPQYADNAIHRMSEVLQAISSIEWDAGSDDFPGTSLQITHIDSGQFTDNIVPAQCSICFNIRYSHCYDQQQLAQLIESRIKAVTSDYELSWDRPCEPYFTAEKSSQSLIGAIERAIQKNTGSFPLLSTSGGTSDGRFFASDVTQVVELGVPNQTIHQIDERIHIADLITLEDIYTDLLADLLA